MKRILLILALASGGANAHAQMGWQLPRVQQYFDQPDAQSGLNQIAKGDELVGRVHRDSDRVLS